MAELDNTKKVIIVAICAGLSVVIAGYQVSGWLFSDRSRDLTWMKCTQCGNAFQITEGEYFEFSQHHLTPAGNPVSPIDMDPEKGYQCPECTQTSALKAIKCSECQNVFIIGEASRRQPGTCPECGHF